jgi:Zn finger protein HypA/HybF involved in hydrogenase expression
MIIINVQCDECQATCIIEHDLEEKSYEVVHCPFCGAEDIQIEEDL